MIQVDIGQLVALMGIPSAITGFCFWLLEHRIQRREKERDRQAEERRKAAERAEREERRARLGIEIEKNDSQVGDRRFARGRAYEADRFKDKKQDAENNN